MKKKAKQLAQKGTALLLVLLLTASLGFVHVSYALASGTGQVSGSVSEKETGSAAEEETEEIFSYEKFRMLLSTYEIPIDKENGILAEDAEIAFSVENMGNVRADRIELTGEFEFPEGIVLPESFKIREDVIEGSDGRVYFELQKAEDESENSLTPTVIESGISLESVVLEKRKLTCTILIEKGRELLHTMDGWILIFHGDACMVEDYLKAGTEASTEANAGASTEANAGASAEVNAGANAGDTSEEETGGYMEQLMVGFEASIRRDGTGESEDEEILLSDSDYMTIYDADVAENSSITLFAAPNTLSYGSAVDYEYGSGYFQFPKSGESRYGSSLSSWKTCTSGGHAGEKYKAITAKSKDKNCYVDMYSNGRMNMDGVSTAIDTRMYIWTDSKAAIREKEGSTLNVCAWGQVVPSEKSVNLIHMEFHFYKAGTLDTANPEEIKSPKGFMYFCDMDVNEAYKVEQGGVQYYTHENAAVEYNSKTGFYYGTEESAVARADEHSFGVAFSATQSSPFTVCYDAQETYSMTARSDDVCLTYKIVGDIPAGETEESLTPEARNFALYTNTKQGKIWGHTDVPGYTFTGWKTNSSMTGSNYTGENVMKKDVIVYGTYKEQKGGLRVKKVITNPSKYGPEDASGFTFYLKGTSDSGVYVNVSETTDAEGTAVFSDIPVGTYMVIEDSASIGSWWTVPDSGQITVLDGTESVTMTNVYQTGNVKVIKKMSDPSGNIRDAGGFRFEIRGTSTSGEEVLEYGVTDENGIFIFKNLPIGTYTLTEIGTPDRAEAIPDWWDGRNVSQKVTVTNGSTVSVTADNIYKTGNLDVQKSIEEAKADKYHTESERKYNYNDRKSGFVFRLSGISDSGIEVEEFAVTDESGLASFRDIPIGTKDNYTLTEVGKDVAEQAAADGNKSASSIKSKATQTLSQYVTPEEQKVSITYNSATHSQNTAKISDYHNTLVKWRISIKKKDFETDEYRLSQGEASLKGAVYGLYDDGKLVDTYSTDQNGEFTTKYYVLGDQWYIQEIQAGEGYLIDPKPYPVQASVKDITSGQEYNDAGLDTDTQRGTDTDTVYEHVQKGSVKYYKIKGDTKETDKSWLAGAGFSVFFLPELNEVYDTDFSNMSDEKVIQYFFDQVRTSDSQGYDRMIGIKTATVFAERTDEDVVSGSLVKKLRWADGTEYDGELSYENEYLVPELVSDPDGMIKTPGLPYGRYIIVETTVPEGHVAAAPKIITIDKDETDGEIYGDKKSDGYMDLVIWDADVTAYIKITKQDAATGKDVAAAGAQYVIHDIDGTYFDWYMEDATTEMRTDYKKRYGDLVVDLSNNNRGSYNKPYTTEVMEDADGDPVGTFIRTVRELPQGRYVLEELKAPDGYILQGKEGLYRTDKNGSTFYEVENYLDDKWDLFHQHMSEDMNGIWIKNKEKASVDSRVMVTISENTAKYDPEIAAFIYEAYQPNDPAVGKVSVYVEGQKLTGARQEGTTILDRLMDQIESFLGYIKGDIGQEEDLSDYKNYTFDYTYKPMKGSGFVIRAAEDIAVNGVEHFAKGDVVAELTTDQNGQAWTQEIRTNAGYSYYGLPVGSYTITENIAGDGFALSEENKKPREFEITYDGEEVPIVYRDEAYVNPRQEVHIELDKYDYETAETVGGAVFGLYTGEDIKDENGRIVVKSDTLVSIAETTEGKGAHFVNGYTTDDDVSADGGLPLGKYYAKELKSPKGYISTDQVIRLDASYDESQALHIDLTSQKFEDAYCFINEQTKIQINLMDYGSREELDGAVLTVIDTETEKETARIVSVHGNNAVIRGLEAGKTYTVKEVRPKSGYTNHIYTDPEYQSPYVEKGYTIDGKVFDAIELPAENTRQECACFTVRDQSGVQIVSLFNQPVKADIEIHKQGEVARTDIKNKELAGITYEMKGLPDTYYDVIAGEDICHPDGYSPDVVKAGTRIAEQVKTNADGFVYVKDLYPGTYKITETKAPAGYFRDRKECSVTADVRDFYEKQIFEKEKYGENTFLFKQEFTNERQQVDLGNSKIPVRPYDPSDPTADLYNKTGVYKEGVDDTITRVEGAEFTLYAEKDIVDIFGNISIPAGTRIETAVSGEDGRAVFESDLPVGTYVVRETAHPYGYYSTDAEVIFDTSAYEKSDEVQVIRMQGTIRNVITTTKVFLTDDLTNKELAGASLKVKDGDGKEFTVLMTENTEGSGHVIKGLNPDTKYTIEEIIPRDGYTNTILIPEKMNGILTKAADNAVTFTIPDTVVKGDLSNAPDVTELEIRNAFITGNIGLTKEGEILENVTQSMEKRTVAKHVVEWVKSIFHYKDKNLEGAEFTAYAAEDIYHPDGVTGLLYQKGDPVKIHVRSKEPEDAVVTTDQSGEAVFAEMYLGMYELEETKVPEGYVKNNERLPVTLAWKDYTTQSVDAQEGQIKAVNARQKTHIHITKTDADVSDKKLKGAVFGIYTKEAVRSGTGDILLEKDRLIETQMTDQKGEAVFASDLPLGQYYIKELAAPRGYRLSGRTEEIDASWKQEEADVLQFDIVFGNKSLPADQQTKEQSGSGNPTVTAVPKTGDPSRILLLVFLTAASGAGVFFFGTRIRR